MPASSCGIPSSAQAYSLNLTAVVPSGGNLVYLTAFPAGNTLPNASTVNAPDGVVASGAIVPAGTGGAISVFASNATDLLIDINGYFAPSPASPPRMISAQRWEIFCPSFPLLVSEMAPLEIRKPRPRCRWAGAGEQCRLAGAGRSQRY